MWRKPSALNRYHIFYCYHRHYHNIIGYYTACSAHKRPSPEQCTMCTAFRRFTIFLTNIIIIARTHILRRVIGRNYFDIIKIPSCKVFIRPRPTATIRRETSVRIARKMELGVLSVRRSICHRKTSGNKRSIYE